MNRPGSAAIRAVADSQSRGLELQFWMKNGHFWTKGTPRISVAKIGSSQRASLRNERWGVVVCSSSSCWENDPIGGNTVASYDVADKIWRNNQK